MNFLLRIDMVASAVVQTIEDDTLVGNAITVTQKSGIRKHSFSKAKL